MSKVGLGGIRTKRVEVQVEVGNVSISGSKDGSKEWAWKCILLGKPWAVEPGILLLEETTGTHGRVWCSREALNIGVIYARHRTNLTGNVFSPLLIRGSNIIWMIQYSRWLSHLIMAQS